MRTRPVGATIGVTGGRAAEGVVTLTRESVGAGAPSDAGRRPGLGALAALAAVVGVLAALGAALFSSLVHLVEGWLWESVPHAMGRAEAPWWWVLLLLVIGAVGVAGATRLPGHGGHRPLDGLAFDITPRELPSTLLATSSSLVFGAVLGPEAPLLAIGSSIGFAVHRRMRSPASRVLVMAGAAAGLGVVLGNPAVTALLVLEAAFLSARPSPERPLGMMVVILVALGAGYLVRIGVGGWSGVHVPELSMGDIGSYPAVRVTDLLVGAGVAVVVAALVVAATRGAEAASRVGASRPSAALVTGALVIGGLAVVVRAVTGAEVGTVLFSGQQALGGVGSTAGGTLLVIVLAKAAAYAVSLGTGFRGGIIFPAVFLGAAVGAAAAALVPGTSLAPMVACGIAAGAAAAAGLPVTALVLALLLCLSAGPAVTVPAILGAVGGAMAKAFARARRPAPARGD
ncbi:chloride channel protein [Myceligenerans indicum]|uniref:Chloride channel protein n=1 Tax=Myceligenerans indicum TaxID=2593663 RepID=A0ABS1LI68_9MICO|nr:chloride channel protein [Myceligenerans indicum]MBL0885935.1 chloride channel protein [Myceligenerans indicum]